MTIEQSCLTIVSTSFIPTQKVSTTLCDDLMGKLIELHKEFELGLPYRVANEAISMDTVKTIREIQLTAAKETARDCSELSKTSIDYEFQQYKDSMRSFYYLSD